MQLYILLFIAAVAGALLTWIIRKLVFEKNHVSKISYENLERENQELIIDK
ncbi:MAG: hypothetical protein GXC73_14190, partial [Chitinophagaceae bacterium]|nr:hypothetical protein [Chitinophagaceae bacterium]